MNELYHWGYIKRWKENGEWKYLYPDDVGGKKYNSPTGVVQTNRSAFGVKRKGTLNTDARTLMKTGSARRATRYSQNPNVNANKPKTATVSYDSGPSEPEEKPKAQQKIDTARVTVERILTNQQIAERRAANVSARYTQAGLNLVSRWMHLRV